MSRLVGGVQAGGVRMQRWGHGEVSRVSERGSQGDGARVGNRVVDSIICRDTFSGVSSLSLGYRQAAKVG